MTTLVVHIDNWTRVCVQTFELSRSSVMSES